MLAIKVRRRLSHRDVLEVLAELFCERDVPIHIRSDNGSEFTAKRVREWLERLDVKPPAPATTVPNTTRYEWVGLT